MTHPVTCQAALLTPPGRGAVATIQVRGAGSHQCVERHFHAAAGKPLAAFPVGRIVFGHWTAAAVDVGEELIVCRTTNETVEIHCHGGKAATLAILQSLKSARCDIADWRNWIAHAAPDPIAAAALAALATAPTAKSARILLDQYHGALHDAIEQILSHCDANERKPARAELHELHRHSRTGLHLCQPWRVVLAGPPNAGKSSLLNSLVGFARSIVFDQPGTTRDVLTATTAVDGWPVELADTAGLRASSDDIEQQGVARAQDAAEAADLLLLVFDLALAWRPEDQLLVDAYPAALIVHNKSDLTNSVQNRPAGLIVSARTGENVECLVNAISDRLVPHPPPDGAAVPFTQPQADAVEQALALATSGDLAGAATRLRDCYSSISYLS